MQLVCAKMEITPDQPVRLSGYLETRTSRGVLNAPEVRALVFSFDDAPPLVFLTYDLLGIDRCVADRVVAQIGEPLCASRVLVSATHTHSAPEGSVATPFNRYTPDEAYLDLLVTRSVAVVKQALLSLSPFVMRQTQTTIEGVFTNRHDPRRYADQRWLITEFKTSSGKQVMWLCGCGHPTVFKQDNTLLSCDLVGGLARLFPEHLLIFHNGAAGDVSTRFTRATDDLKQINQFAEMIATQISHTLDPLDWVHPAHMEHFAYETQLELASDQDVQNLGQKRAMLLKKIEAMAQGPKRRGYETALEGLTLYQIMVMSNRVRYGHFKQISGHIIRMGQVVLVSVPFEMFSVLLQALFARQAVYILGYTDGYDGYLTDGHAFVADEYERFMSPFAQGEGEKMAGVIENLVSRY